MSRRLGGAQSSLPGLACWLGGWLTLIVCLPLLIFGGHDFNRSWWLLASGLMGLATAPLLTAVGTVLIALAQRLQTPRLEQ
jgi:hypothetical protein